MLSFHGKESVKKKYLKRVIAHRKADEIVKGIYWQKGKGCAVGCTIHGDNHFAYETELGIPAWIAFLEDDLFERMPNEDAKEWPARFLEAVPVGKDPAWFDRIKSQFLHYVLVDEKDGVVNVATRDDVKGWIRSVAVIHEKLGRGEVPTDDEKVQAERAARDAWDAWAAWAAWDAWAAWAAWAARDAWAARAARDARDAWDAWDAWAASVAVTAKKQSEKLLELLVKG
jgi:hypothetical protein